MTIEREIWKTACYLHPKRSTPVTVSYRELREDEMSLSAYRRSEDVNYTCVRFPPLDDEPGRFEWIRKSHLLQDPKQAQEYLDLISETDAKIRKMRNELITLEGVGF